MVRKYQSLGPVPERVNTLLGAHAGRSAGTQQTSGAARDAAREMSDTGVAQARQVLVTLRVVAEATDVSSGKEVGQAPG